MFENRSDLTFDAASVDGAKATILRDQLVVWRRHIATEARKMRELGNRSAVVDAFVAETFEATNPEIAPDVERTARLNLKADLIFQLVEYLGAEKKPEFQADLEKQLTERAADAPAPTEETIDELLEAGKDCARDARRARVGAEAFALQETIEAALSGIAPVVRGAVDLARRAIPKREFEIEGLRKRVKETRARDAKEREAKAALANEAERLAEAVEDWKERISGLIDGIYESLAFLAPEPTDVDALSDAIVKTGKLAADAFEMFERGTLAEYGAPSPTGVRFAPAPGKCVLFDGDDFDALRELLEIAEECELNVWTRGDAVAAHSFPAFKKYRRLVGAYGGSWRDQQKEFGAFPGAIFAASAPLQEPDDSYRDYLFAVGDARRAGVATVERKPNGKLDFEALIRAALDSSGFFKPKAPVDKIAVGFAGDAFDGTVDKTARAFRQGRLKRLVVVGGEDAPEADADYFARLYDALPTDVPVAAFGDAKFRFNRKPSVPTPFGTPRLLDFGRIVDAGAVLRLAKAFGTELDRVPETTPIAFFVSVAGEKSLAALLALWALGYRDVVIGPTAPSDWTPETVALVAEKFGTRVASDPAEDVAVSLA